MPPRAGWRPHGQAFLITEDRVLEALRQLYDPEQGVVNVTMTLTTPSCPLYTSLTEVVDEALRLFMPGVETVQVDLVWEPPWSPDCISPAGRAELGWE